MKSTQLKTQNQNEFDQTIYFLLEHGPGVANLNKTSEFLTNFQTRCTFSLPNWENLENQRE